MGWLLYGATCFKNGRIDRKAECEKLFGDSLVKGSLKGTTYYAAVRGKDSVFGVVVLTTVSGWDFGYKDITEDMGPYSYDCPKSILKLLTPTDSEWANEWRRKCAEYHENSKKLEACPIGAKIVIDGFERELSRGVEIPYRKVSVGKRDDWMEGIYYIPKHRILNRGFKIVDDDYLNKEKEISELVKKYFMDSDANSLKESLKYKEYGLKESWYENMIKYWERFYGRKAA